MVGHVCNRIEWSKCKLKCTEDKKHLMSFYNLAKPSRHEPSKVSSTLRTQRLKTIRPPCKRLALSGLLYLISAQKQGRKMSKEKDEWWNLKMIDFIYFCETRITMELLTFL